MGTDEVATTRLAAILRTDLPVLVDADGLTILSQHEDLLPRPGQAAPQRRPSVVDVVREQLRLRELPADLDREQLIALGMKYLADAEATMLTPNTLEPEG